MDQKELQEKIALYYSILPPNVQEMFSSMKWLETLKIISQKYGLSEEQKETLGTETTLVLLGIIHLVEYEEALTNELKLPRNSADKMLLEIEESIIKTIRPQLVEAFEANKKSETEDGTNIEAKLDERFERLPKETQDIIIESNYRATLYIIAREYNLNVEQTGILEKVTTNLVIGAIQPGELQILLEKNLKLPPEILIKIISDVNDKIFKKIREKLVKDTEKRKASAKSKKNDTEILDLAGIKIINKPTQDLPFNQHQMEEKIHSSQSSTKPKEINNLPIPEKLELNGKVLSILTQKLSSSVQIPTTKTEHSLENITKNANETKTTPPKAPTVYEKNKDPYRLSPDE